MNLRKLLYPVLASLVLLISGCNNDDDYSPETGTLELKFHTYFDGESLQLHDFYAFQGGEFEFTMVQFYVCNVSVENQSGEKTLIKDVDLINVPTHTSFSASLAPGSYNQLFVGLGLDEILGATDPSSYLSSHPLSLNQNNFWIMSQSYIFVKVEGFFNYNGQRLPVVYHLGDETFYRNLQDESLVLSVEKNQTTTVNIAFHLDKLFDEVTLPDQDNTHTINDFPLALQMMNNLAAALEIVP
jgi:hypothetical protein